MLDTVLNILSPEMIILGIVMLTPLFLLVTTCPEFAVALSVPAWLFLGQLREHCPVSVSAAAALLPIFAMVGGVLRGHNLRFGRLGLAFLLLAIWMILGLRYSEARDYGTEKVVLVLFHSFAVVLAAWFILSSFQKLERVLIVISLSLTVYVAISFTYYMLGENFEGRFGALHDVTVAGQINGWAAVLAICWWWPRGGHWRAVAGAIVLASLYLALLSGTRAVLLAVLVTVVVVQYLKEGDLTKFVANRFVHVCLAACLVVVVSLVAGQRLSSLLPTDAIRSRFSSLEGFFKIDNLDDPNARVLNYSVALKAYLRHPVRGLGAGGYKEALTSYMGRRGSYWDDERHPVYPHNIFLEFLVEQGLPGILLFGFIVYRTSKLASALRVRLSALSERERLVAVSVAATFVYGLLLAQTALDQPRQHIFWWGLGMLLSLSYLVDARSHTAKAETDPIRQAFSRPQAVVGEGSMA
jgi:O-antigen ligase